MNNFSETQILSLQRGKHSTYQMCRLVCSDPRQPIEEKQCAYKIGNIALDGRENRNVNIVDLDSWSAHTRRGAKNARRVVILGQLQLNRQHGQTNRPLNSNDQSFDHMTLAIRSYAHLFWNHSAMCLHLERLFSVCIICSKWPFHRFRANSSVRAVEFASVNVFMQRTNRCVYNVMNTFDFSSNFVQTFMFTLFDKQLWVLS